MRRLVALSINVAVAVLAYFGFIVGVEGAANVTMVMLWLAIVLSPFALSEGVSDDLKAQPYWYKVLDTLYDISMTIFLLWIGMMWTGVFYLIHLLLVAAARWGERKE